MHEPPAALNSGQSWQNTYTLTTQTPSLFHKFHSVHRDTGYRCRATYKRHNCRSKQAEKSSVSMPTNWYWYMYYTCNTELQGIHTVAVKLSNSTTGSLSNLDSATVGWQSFCLLTAQPAKNGPLKVMHSSTWFVGCHELVPTNCFSCHRLQFHRSWPSRVLACIEMGMVPRYLAASMVANGSLTVQFATSKKCCQKWKVHMWSQSKLYCEQDSLLAIRCLRSVAARASPASSQQHFNDIQFAGEAVMACCQLEVAHFEQ